LRLLWESVGNASQSPAPRRGRKNCMYRLALPLLALIALWNSHAQPAQVRIAGSLNASNLELELPPPALVDVETVTSIETSGDLRNWQSFGVFTNDASSFTRLPIGDAAQRGFFRSRLAQHLKRSKDPGAEVYGYASEYAKNLRALGFLSLAGFTNQFAPPAYLPQLSWDPTTSDFWDEFNLDIDAYNATLPSGSPDRRITSFRMDAAELELFKRNGFVVSQRMQTWSFGESFYRIFMDDLPVFISSDAILQAWHQVFKTMLTEWELYYIEPQLKDLLAQCSTGLGSVAQEHGSGPFAASVKDADTFLTVARSLITGQQQSSVTGQDTEVTRILEAIAGEEYHQSFPIFGAVRPMDFTQFKPRGNYESRPNYFRCLMWLGRVDFRIADPTPGALQAGAMRELATAIALQEALRANNGAEQWSETNRIIEFLIGHADSMNFLQLAGLLEGASMQTLAQIRTEENLAALQRAILNGNLGFQQIRGDVFFTPLDGSQRKLPRSFAFSGQKFVFDSWALSKVVHDDILWPDSSGTLRKVERLMPSTLDVAFAALGNDAVTPLIASGIAKTSPSSWRDGHPYQHNLAAVRAVIDAQKATVWTNSSIYNAWLGALRELSKPTTSPAYPEVFRTKAWALKQTQSQLSGWTQLRHDTLLYAKGSYTVPILCSYPHGYVEPVPTFWRTMEGLSGRMAEVFSSFTNSLTRRPDFTNQLHHLSGFQTTMRTLAVIAEKQLNSLPLTDAENNFLKDVVEIHKTYDGKLYSGWYPKLFYRSLDMRPESFPVNYGCERPDQLIVDIHTKVPDERGPGRVLHAAVGHPNMLLIAVECGPEKVMYAGPVFSYYDVETDGVERLTDTDWRSMQSNARSPEWTKEFLVQP